MLERPPAGLSQPSCEDDSEAFDTLQISKKQRLESHEGFPPKHRVLHNVSEAPPPSKNESQADSFIFATHIARAAIIGVACICVVYKQSIQFCIEHLWNYLRNQPFFYNNFFESIYVTIVYALILAVHPIVMHYTSFMSRFKVQSDVTYVHHTIREILQEAVMHLAPLFAVDLVKMKKYSGVPQEELDARSKQWVHMTRALPAEAPDFFTMCAHVVAAVVVFDALYFILHLTLHKSAFLYRHIHSLHHQHGPMHAHLTNQMSVLERGAIIVAANISLRVWCAHPLTRLVFVVVFLWLLVDNHTGYDLPWSPHRLMPAGVMGGPAKHHAHHVHGSRNYQQFFTYLDYCLEVWEGRRSCKKLV